MIKRILYLLLLVVPVIASGQSLRKNAGGGGSGLGLAIAKNAVELQGGGIRLESKETSGIRFVLTLPVR